MFIIIQLVLKNGEKNFSTMEDSIHMICFKQHVSYVCTCTCRGESVRSTSEVTGMGIQGVAGTITMGVQ